MKLHFSLSLIMLLILSQYGFSQEKGYGGNDSIKLYVIAIEKVSRHPLNNVAILNSVGDTVVFI